MITNKRMHCPVILIILRVIDSDKAINLYICFKIIGSRLPNTNVRVDLPHLIMYKTDR